LSNTLSYADACTPRGYAIERRIDGVIITVPPLHPARRAWLAVGTGAAVVVGPLAAAFMIATGFGWGVPLVVLALILAPAVALRITSGAGDAAPQGGPDAVFHVDRERLEVTLRRRHGVRSMSWPLAEVSVVRAGWFGTGLVIRAGGRVAAEVLHGHSLCVRTRVAETLNSALRAAHRPRS
jgi:hypothetical protein